MNQPWLALDLPHLSGGSSNEAVLYAVLNISKLSHKIELKFRSDLKIILDPCWSPADQLGQEVALAG